MHMYLPWWKFDRKNDFLRGYHTEFGGGRGMPGVGDYGDLCDEFDGYGASLKKECKKKYGTYMGFATDGGAFVTNADKNPTLTIMALTWRASDYLLDQAKKGNL
jgi:uncharacterized hydantoinase/oxoprolinase family protein